tara:strand:+ start:819 stop:1052 length:234 start_codon:yes stop_codon:yes gene_type:complete
MALRKFTLCILEQDNRFEKTDKEFRARDPLSAAKKAFRSNKSLNPVYILDNDTTQVFVYDTSTFFTVKKEFKKHRKR